LFSFECVRLIRSTFLKQMKIIHGRGFRAEEKRRIIPFIYQQILTVVRCICRAMENLRINFEKAQNEVCLNYKQIHNHPFFMT
jgi:hypothetical protein